MFEAAKGKKLLIIGCETNIINIVNEAKKMGVYTIVVERGTDIAKLPAKAVADEAWDVDYSDMDTLEGLCREHGVDGIMSGYSEGKVLWAATLAQRMGMPFYVTPEQVEVTRNKRRFKALCEEHGVPIAKEYCANGHITDSERDAVQYPAIVKPSDYGGRIGISVCWNREELDKAIEKAESSSVSGTVVVEDYLHGTELMVIYTVVDGEISLSLINDKYLSKEGNAYACLCDVAIAPTRFYDLYMETVDGPIRKMIQSLGMTDGIATFQFIANPQKIVAFEMGLRLNGGNDWKVLDACNGINYMQMLIHHSLTGSMGGDLSKDNPLLGEYMSTYVVYAHGGEVGSFSYDGLEQCPEIIDISPYAKPGKVVVDKGTTQQRVISFKIRTATLEDMERVILHIQENVKMQNVDGENMLFARFDTKRFFA